MAANQRSRQGSTATRTALIGAAVAAGAAALFFGRRNADNGETISDAPDHVLRDRDRSNHALVGKSVTVGKPKREVYDAWRDFTRFPQFMDNLRSVEKLDEKRSRWTIEAPAGTTVELVTRITEDRAGELIAWESEPESQIATQVQARRDLRRFKQLIETGEVSTNASPSGRGEDPGEPRL